MPLEGDSMGCVRIQDLFLKVRFGSVDTPRLTQQFAISEELEFGFRAVEGHVSAWHLGFVLRVKVVVFK